MISFINLKFLHHSGVNQKTSQSLIPGTSRSAIITKTGDYEYAVEVHRIQDMLLVDPQEWVYKSALVVNVGFATTTSYHGPQPVESLDDWQDIILHVIKTWSPEHRFLVRSGIPDMLRNAITSEFITSLRGSINVDVYEDDGGLSFDKM